MVYDIIKKNDSIFFSTSRSGIYRFNPAQPDSVYLIAAKGKNPFRTITFWNDDTLLASSYEMGLYYLTYDTFAPYEKASTLAWSMKILNDTVLWQVGTLGVFRYANGINTRFINSSSAHDIAFKGDTLCIADLNGLKKYVYPDSSPVEILYPESNFWFVHASGDTLIAGGRTLFISYGSSRKNIELIPKGNIIWDIVISGDHKLYLATQKGLYCYDLVSGSLKRVGYKNRCVKSLFIDNNGTLWVGEYF